MPKTPATGTNSRSRGDTAPRSAARRTMTEVDVERIRELVRTWPSEPITHHHGSSLGDPPNGMGRHPGPGGARVYHHPQRRQRQGCQDRAARVVVPSPFQPGKDQAAYWPVAKSSWPIAAG